MEKFGEGHESTITHGSNLSHALRNADHAIEAERLLAKLYDIAKRVHGADHRLTT